MLNDFLKPYIDAHDNKKDIRKLQKVLDKVNSYEHSIHALSDEELKEKTQEFKDRLNGGATLDEILPEAYAVVREGSARVLGKRHFDVQIMGGIVLNQGRIAEMRTGEGKTLVATLPVYLNALTEKGVHVVTANEYLARRDSEEMGELYRFLGLSVGMIYANMPQEERKAAYQKDITYGTHSEFGFDYLRDNMYTDVSMLVQRDLYYALVDEVDSILIDEARTPLVIAGAGDASTDGYVKAAALMRGFQPSVDYEVDLKEKAVSLTEAGVAKVEDYFGISNLADEENLEIAAYVNNSLRAHAIMKRDVDYVVKDGEVIIVDSFTGRLMYGRRFNDGLHQAIEAKEGLEIQQETQVLASITVQNFFRMYQKLSGMTGTAKTEEDEFRSIYGMDVVPIPTNKPVKRVDLADVVYRTEAGKFQAIVNKIDELHKIGQPILVGTVSIEVSEHLSSLLKKKKLPHQVLNAKVHDLEAEIISHAGEFGSITIATNMAGRGTDIKLGIGVRELGGLYIIGTERHESRRIDNQLRGRSGRQGDPGTTQFFLSIEDDLIRRFCPNDLNASLDKIGLEDSIPLESNMLTKSIEGAQKRVETNNFEIRKRVLEYDDVLNKQRSVIYAERKKVLLGADIGENILVMADRIVHDIVTEVAGEEKFPEAWDITLLEKKMGDNFFFSVSLTRETLAQSNQEEIETLLCNMVHIQYRMFKELLGEEPFSMLERDMMLKYLDREWKDHMDAMEQLKEGIGLRAYGQKNPAQEYKFEAYTMFQSLTWRIQCYTVNAIFRSAKILVEKIMEA